MCTRYKFVTMNLQFIQIVAVSSNGVIGNGLDIPWKIKADLAYFKEKTSGHICIVGRRTYETIKHLKNRRFIVISSALGESESDTVRYVSSVEDSIEVAKEWASQLCDNRVYIIGGAQIYQQTFSYTDRIYATRIEKVVEGDTFYEIPEDFSLTNVSEPKTENRFMFYFTEYKRHIQ